MVLCDPMGAMRLDRELTEGLCSQPVKGGDGGMEDRMLIEEAETGELGAETLHPQEYPREKESPDSGLGILLR